MESYDHQSEETKDENPDEKSLIGYQYGGGREDVQHPKSRLQILFEVMKKKDEKQWFEVAIKKDEKERFQAMKDKMVSLGTLDVFFASPIETRNENNIKIQFWRENGYPKPILIGLMRDIVNLVNAFESNGLTHWELRPCCVSITSGDYPLDPEKEPGLYAELSQECFKTGHESSDFSPPDVVVALGQLLFFCMTGGDNTDSRATKCLKTSSDGSAAEQATKSDLDFTALKNIPEAMDLIPALLNSRPDKRYVLGEFEYLDDIKQHPLFWDDHTKFMFMIEASPIVGGKGCHTLVRVSLDASFGSSDKSDQDDVEKVKRILRGIGSETYYLKKNVLGGFNYKPEVRERYLRGYPSFFELYKAIRECDPGFIPVFCYDLGWD